jgi:carbamoyltransferase
MYILGISAFYHDSAACLIHNENIIAAAQEERFTRIKHDNSFPSNSIIYCLKEAKITAKDLSHVVFYEKPFLKFERLLETYLAYAPIGFFSFTKAMPSWIKNKLFLKTELINSLNNLLGKKIKWNNILLFSEHHLSHAASAFYPSPFESAAIITLDGVGEWTTSSIAIGKGNNLKIIKEIHFPHSLGLLYSAFTYYAGFKVNSGEYKVMGLAPYGRPIYANLIKENLIDICDDGSFKLNMSFFSFASGLTMTNKKFNKLFGGKPRKPESKITQKEMDLAASLQNVLEEVILKISKNVAKETGEDNLCLAGGVALNCVANGALLREKIFKNIWIQPASGDAGGSLGAALAIYYLHYKSKRNVSAKNDSMKGSYLGPNYSNEEVKKNLNKLGAIYTKVSDDELFEKVSRSLIKGKAIGWMQGRMEFGPRALGARSIIADPRSSIMQKQLNLKVKFRESFRPFAPSILREYLNEWFNIDIDSPYMLIVDKIKLNKRYPISKKEENFFGIEKLNLKRSDVPAITHVDCSARIQTVHSATNDKFHKLISKFYEKTGCPMIVNTSFNIRGEPIVCKPEDAFKCFMSTQIDMLVIGNYILEKKEQNMSLSDDYKKEYELD